MTQVVLYSTDLTLISSVGRAAADAGLSFRNVRSLSELSVCTETTRLCVDLSAPGADPESVAAVVPAAALRNAVAFGPHVHTAKLESARAAGFGRVVSRGRFATDYATLLAKPG